VAVPALGRARAARNFGVETLDGILHVDELLIELAEARLDFLELSERP